MTCIGEGCMKQFVLIALILCGFYLAGLTWLALVA